MKTSELVGTALDWAVAKCEEPVGGYKAWVQADLDKGILHGCHYSTDWEWCGPIIEREKINLITTAGYPWRATVYMGGGVWIDQHGPTPLIAAMRCYVASKLGEMVEVPEELAALVKGE